MNGILVAMDPEDRLIFMEGNTLFRVPMEPLVFFCRASAFKESCGYIIRGMAM